LEGKLGAGQARPSVAAWSAQSDNPGMGAGDPGRPVGQAGVRVSHAERERALGELGDGFVEGRLTQDTFVHRVEAALRARVRGELTGLVVDLPRPRRLGDTARELATSMLRGLAAAGRVLHKAPSTLTLPAGPQLRFTIGREPACDMTLSDNTVSRWHASLHREQGAWLLSDLGSTNGTRLNGWRVSGPIQVAPGDLVSFGAATFVLTERPAATPPRTIS
jgi:hypothetical protein